MDKKQSILKYKNMEKYSDEELKAKKKIIDRKYYLTHTEKRKENSKIYYENHREEINLKRKEHNARPEIKARIKITQKKYLTTPRGKWIHLYHTTRQRCEDPKNLMYPHYGGKGIKLLLSKEEFGKLFYFQGADKMINPSPHRPNEIGNYELRNLIFLPLFIHRQLHSHRKERKNAIN